MDKKITPKDAAMAVLKKAEEMLKSSKMAKSLAPAAAPAPVAAPKEQNVTPPDGVIPEPKAATPQAASGNGVHKLAHFMGKRSVKRNGNPEKPPVQAPIAGTAAPMDKKAGK